MKSRTNGETFRVGMVLLKAVEDKTNKSKGVISTISVKQSMKADMKKRIRHSTC